MLHTLPVIMVMYNGVGYECHVLMNVFHHVQRSKFCNVMLIVTDREKCSEQGYGLASYMSRFYVRFTCDF